MALILKGERVTLITRVSMMDKFNHPTWSEVREDVDNVFIGEPTQNEQENGFDIKHERATYILGIPKGDTHNWQDAEVELWGRKWRQVGHVIQGMEHLIPLDWNKKIMVEEIL